MGKRRVWREIQNLYMRFVILKVRNPLLCTVSRGPLFVTERLPWLWEWPTWINNPCILYRYYLVSTTLGQNSFIVIQSGKYGFLISKNTSFGLISYSSIIIRFHCKIGEMIFESILILSGIYSPWQKLIWQRHTMEQFFCVGLGSICYLSCFDSCLQTWHRS